jgi:hypothetical protein
LSILTYNCNIWINGIWPCFLLVWRSPTHTLTCISQHLVLQKKIPWSVPNRLEESAEKKSYALGDQAWPEYIFMLQDNTNDVRKKLFEIFSWDQHDHNILWCGILMSYWVKRAFKWFHSCMSYLSAANENTVSGSNDLIYWWIDILNFLPFWSWFSL